uniref:Uncharacterized protein n=1 Tax=Avena sativa TaxID=4498 RepID=A0ACD5VAN1_AVESA
MRIGVHDTHRVDLMSVEVGWELLWKSMNIYEEKEVHSLRNIGFAIIRTCGFLPLAIKVTASVLASKDQTENEWNRILSKYACSQSMLSNEIEGALYLSYDDLPHRLKQCFLYCALYVEDSAILRRVITRLWIAEGFINEQPGQLLEDTAEEYYYDLIHRNLLQPSNGSFDQAVCKMHDLLRQLALSISKDECFIGDVETLKGENISKLRRVTAVNKKDRLVLPSMNKVEVKVRTFFTGHGPQSIEDTLFRRFLLLRVLVLNYSLVQSIPDCIGKLIHLRLLDLDYTGISCLPESIGYLKNLQILSLNYCDSLHKLPLAMTKLYSLRCLSLLDTVINQVPKGIGKLKFLTDLRGFPVGEGSDNTDVQDGWKLEELSSVSLLRYLTLVKLERATHCSSNTVLRDKKHLKALVLEWTSNSEYVSKTEKVFEHLIPPRNLQTLYLIGFIGRRYPKWFSTTCLSSLLHLILRNLRSCVLPPVGQLPNLKYLRIEGANAVTKVGPEFVGYKNGDPHCTELVAFPKLEWLIITGMPNWEEWSFFDEEALANERGDDGATQIQKDDAQTAKLQIMPCLVKLKLLGCPKLRALPPQLGEDTIGLKNLELVETNNLKTVEDLALLSEVLIINKCEGLKRLSNLPRVSELHVSGCPNLSHVDGLISLRRLWLGEDMQEISRSWVPGLQMQHQHLHREDLDVYTMFSS